MNASSLHTHLERLDEALDEPASLCVYGSDAIMLLGEEDRFSLDLDIAGPYSEANESALHIALSGSVFRSIHQRNTPVSILNG